MKGRMKQWKEGREEASRMLGEKLDRSDRSTPPIIDNCQPSARHFAPHPPFPLPQFLKKKGLVRPFAPLPANAIGVDEGADGVGKPMQQQVRAGGPKRTTAHLETLLDECRRGVYLKYLPLSVRSLAAPPPAHRKGTMNNSGMPPSMQQAMDLQISNKQSKGEGQQSEGEEQGTWDEALQAYVYPDSEPE